MIQIKMKDNPTDADMEEFKSQVGLAFRLAGATPSKKVVKKKTIWQRFVRFLTH